MPYPLIMDFCVCVCETQSLHIRDCCYQGSVWWRDNIEPVLLQLTEGQKCCVQPLFPSPLAQATTCLAVGARSYPAACVNGTIRVASTHVLWGFPLVTIDMSSPACLGGWGRLPGKPLFVSIFLDLWHLRTLNDMTAAGRDLWNGMFEERGEIQYPD